MKKSVLLMIGMMANIIAVEDIPTELRWKQVKTALTSKTAKIIYGGLGIAAVGIAWYIKKVEASFNELIEPRQGLAYFFYDYNLDRKHLAIEGTKFGDGYCINCNSIPADEHKEMERRLLKMARDGQLLNLMPFNNIKVNLVWKKRTPIVVIRTYKSVCG